MANRRDTSHMSMKLLAVSGDPGGARALQIVLKYFFERYKPFIVVDHGFLGQEAPQNWPRIAPDMDDAESKLHEYFKKGVFFAFIFTSSVTDIVPLRLARMARRFGVPIIHLLDHWGNYAKRLEIDGEPRLIPDIYAVMDDLAFSEAVQDGIPTNVLRITGHPRLSGLADEWDKFRHNSQEKLKNKALLSSDKFLIIFFSEPIEQDVETGNFTKWIGKYTEKDVLKWLCDYFQPYSESVQLGIVPHPREYSQDLEEVWKNSCQKLEGGLFSCTDSREALFLADGVVGINAILLYEAWLLGRPVLSVQIGFSRSDICSILLQKEIIFVTDSAQWKKKVWSFTQEIQSKSRLNSRTPDLEFHNNALENISMCIDEFTKK